ncbi:MAG: cytochrome P450 [Bacillaceae bacterium]|nr:cytochrome P450 [Bacillaceae bacterium]
MEEIIEKKIAKATPEEAAELFTSHLKASLHLLDKYGDHDIVQIPTKSEDEKNFFLFNADHIEEVLVKKQKSFKKGKDYDGLMLLLGEGLLTSEGEKHKKQRKLAQPSFHMKSIAQYADLMVKNADNLMKDWQDEQNLLISKEMMEVTLNIITETMFGTKLDEKLLGDIDESFSNFASTFVDKIINGNPSQENQMKLYQAVKTLNKVIYAIIEEKRKLIENGDHEHDLLSMLISSRYEEDGSAMTDKELYDQVMTIFLAGHETTAHTLTWTWYLLSQHPEVEQKFWNELDTVLKGEKPTLESVRQLSYTNCILQESMRLYPAAYEIGREALETVEIGGVTFNKGDNFRMSQYAVQRSERYFDQPHDFIPERFEGDLLRKIPKYAYFPFGGGTRICIGNNLAIMEAVLILATIGQKYKLTLAEDQTVKQIPLITLRPNNGLTMVATKRS